MRKMEYTSIPFDLEQPSVSQVLDSLRWTMDQNVSYDYITGIDCILSEPSEWIIVFRVRKELNEHEIDALDLVTLGPLIDFPQISMLDDRYVVVKPNTAT